MSLFDANLVEIKIYYTFKDRKGTKVLTVLKEEKAEEMLSKPEEKDKVEALTTQWSIMSWREQNTTVGHAYSKTNTVTGEKVFDHITYRDSIIKSCLKSWDIVVNGQPVPVTPDAIDRLPADIIMGLFAKYEKVLEYSEEELGN